MTIISQHEVRMLIKNTFSTMREKVDQTTSSTMLKIKLLGCAHRITELAEMLGNENKVKVVANVLRVDDASAVFTPTENVQAVDELFTQKGV